MAGWIDRGASRHGSTARRTADRYRQSVAIDWLSRSPTPECCSNPVDHTVLRWLLGVDTGKTGVRRPDLNPQTAIVGADLIGIRIPGLSDPESQNYRNPVWVALYWVLAVLWSPLYCLHAPRVYPQTGDQQCRSERTHTGSRTSGQRRRTDSISASRVSILRLATINIDRPTWCSTPRT